MKGKLCSIQAAYFVFVLLLRLIATEDSWEREFVGDAATALWAYIEKSFYDPKNEKVYARYTSIVQSSGMGKSRTIDELGKHHFVIPMNLRSATSTGVHYFLSSMLRESRSFICGGFPPADHAVRDFLCKANTQADAYRSSCAFLQALFNKTAKMVREEFNKRDSSDIARVFRELMTKGQTMQKHNSFRESFYGDIVSQSELILATFKNVRHRITLIRR
jgi:hypothetical protein